ncbi:hypothetical protein, partial [Rickettsia sp. wb]
SFPVIAQYLIYTSLNLTVPMTGENNPRKQCFLAMMILTILQFYPDATVLLRECHCKYFLIRATKTDIA